MDFSRSKNVHFGLRLVAVTVALIVAGCVRPELQAVRDDARTPAFKIEKGGIREYETVGTWENGAIVPRTMADHLWYQAYRAEAGGDRIEAKRLFVQALAEADKKGEQKTIQLTLQELSSMYMADGELAKAEPLYLRLVEIHDQSPSSTRFSSYPLGLAVLYDVMDRGNDAEKYLCRVVKLERRSQGDNSFSYFSAQYALANHYMMHKEWAKAVQVLKEQFSCIHRWDLGFNSFDVEALHKYVVCLRMSGDAEAGVNQLKVAIEPLERSYVNSKSPLNFVSGSDPRMYSNALALLYTDLANCYDALRNTEGARGAYERAKILNVDNGLRVYDSSRSLDPGFKPAGASEVQQVQRIKSE